MYEIWYSGDNDSYIIKKTIIRVRNPIPDPHPKKRKKNCIAYNGAEGVNTTNSLFSLSH